jgi:hypothetical protein
MKVACTVREEAVGKGPQTSGTSLAAYFIEGAREEGAAQPGSVRTENENCCEGTLVIN